MFKICGYQLRTAYLSPRFYISLFMGSAVQLAGIIPLLEYASGVGRPLGIWEGFVYFGCDRYTVSAVFLGIVLLVSDIPFSSENEAYTLLRVSRRKWAAGKILYLFSVCCLYYLAVLLAGMAFLSGNAFGGNYWSEPFHYLAKGLYTWEYSAHFPYSHVLLLSPVQAVFITFWLNVAYGFVMSLFLFFGSLKLPRALAYAAAMLLHACLYLMLSAFQSPYYARYSLLGNSLLMYHRVYGRREEMFPSFLQSFLVLGGAAGILALLIFRGIKDRDFRATAGTKG